MGQDLNNVLGVPHKAGISYFRDWTIGGVNNPLVYGIGDPATSENVGTAMTVRCTDSTNGFQLVINEPGMYDVFYTVRASTNAAAFSVVRFNGALGTTIGNYWGTKDEIATVNITTGSRYATSGSIYMKPGDVVMIITSAANALSNCTFQCIKRASNSL